MKIGGFDLTDVAGALSTSDKGAFANPDIDGNVGGGILKRFTVSFDYDAKTMYLVPNADFDKPDDYDRSGMWLFADNDLLEVRALTPGGPAEKAGIAPGDRITAIGGEPVGKRSLAEWRATLRETPAGTKLPVRITRGARESTVTLTLADLIPPHAKR